MTSQEISFTDEGQMVESQIEIGNGEYIQMTSDAMAANMDSQVQYIGEQQMGSVEMNGQGMMIQTQINGEQQLYAQDETCMQITFQGMVVNEGTFHMQSQDFSQQFLPEGQMGQGQQLIVRGNSGQIVNQEGGFQMQGMSVEGGGIIMQGMGVDQMQMQQMSMQGEGITYAEGGQVQDEQFQLTETSIGEMSHDMNGQQIATQEMSIQGEGVINLEGVIGGVPLQMTEMSMGEQAHVEMQNQEIGFVEGGGFQTSENSVQRVGFVEGGEVQEQQFHINEISMSEMPLEMNGHGVQMEEMSMQEMPLQVQSQETGIIEGAEFQTSEISVQEVGFVEGGEIQEQQFKMSEISMSEMPLEMNEQVVQMQEMSIQEMPLETQSQTIGFVEGGEFGKSEIVVQEVGLVKGGKIQTSEISVQEVGFVEGGEIQEQPFQMSEISMSEMPLEMNGQGVQMQEMSLEMQSQEIGIVQEGEFQTSEILVQEVGFVEGGEIQGQPFQMNEISMSEMPPEMNWQGVQMQEMSLEMQSQEIGIVQEGEFQTSEILVQEVGFVDGGEIQEQQFQMSEVSVSAMPLEMKGEGMQMQEMSMQEMPLEMQSQEIGIVQGVEFGKSEIAVQEVGLVEGGEVHTSEFAVQEIGFVEGGKIQEQEFQMSERSMSEMPLEMNGEGVQMQEMSMQEIPLEFQTSEISVQGVGFVNGGEIQEQEFQMSERSMSEMPLEMNGEGVQMQEMSMQEMSLEMQSKEIGIVEGAEFQTSGILVQEVGFVDGGEIQEQQVQMSELSMSEMPLEMNGQDLQIQEIPLEIKSQETQIAEGGMVQTDQLETSEMKYQEMPFDSQETQIQEMPIQKTSVEELPLQDTSIQETSVQEISVQEMSAQEMPAKEMVMHEITTQDMAVQETSSQMDEASTLKEEQIQQIATQLPSQELQSKENGGDQADKIGVEQFHASETVRKETPLEEESQNITPANERASLTEVTLQEMPFDINQNHMPQMSPTEMLLESQNEELYISTSGMTAQEKPLEKAFQEVQIKEKLSQENQDYKREVSKVVETTLITSEATPLEEPKEDELQEQLSSNNTKNEIVTQKIVCDHDLLIDQFLERISRLEKDKEYLQECYEELRQEKETTFTSQEDQLITRDEHHHCCDIVKDYSSLINYITSPREGMSQDDGLFDLHNHTCLLHSERENFQYLGQTPADYEYYKSKCEQIKREKDRLQKACEAEKRQKEEIEREYQSENDEKAHLEERYQEMLDKIQRFDETTRSLRRNNELLQQNLNDWANTRTMTQTPEMNSMVLGQEDAGAGIAEYKRSIEALEKENNEFRAILEVLNKRNENQQTLKNIEFGLARENEFIELRKDRARLESSLKDLKRMNKHQQQKIEEIRKDSTTEITRLKENCRKLERSLKEYERLLEEKDDEITSLKKRHSEEMQGMQLNLHTEFSASLLSKNKIKDLQSKIQRLEEDRSRLRKELRASSINTGDRFSEVDKEYQDIESSRERYEEERRSKMRLASDMKCLLSDVMELKERNKRLQEDFNRERMEIKRMIEKQAGEITEEYLAQISKLQRSLMEETKRRKEAEAGSYGLIRNQGNGTRLISGQSEFYGTPSWSNSELQLQLNNEIRQRETLEIENKKLLYKVNEILSSGGQGGGERGISHNEDTLYNGKNKQPHLTRHKTPVTSQERQVNDARQKELQSEIEELQEKIEDLKKEVKRNKDLKRKNEELEDEVTHLSRKRDELLAAQRNLTREVDHLSRTLDEVERRNRKLSDETERLTRKIQDIEESFRREKISLARSYESEKSRAVEEVTKLKEACEKRLQVQTDTRRRLEEKILQFEEKMPSNVYVPTEGLERSILNNSHSYTISEDVRGKPGDTYGDKLKQEVKSLEAMLRDVNNKHADDLRNLEIQKQKMSDEFKREKESLENYFQKEEEGLKRRLHDLECNIRGDGTMTIQDLGGSASPGRRSSIGRGLESTDTGLVRYRAQTTEEDSEHTIQEMRRKFNEEKNAILNRASRERTKLEEEVREAKDKVTSYRRLMDDELDDLKRKHRKEVDYLNEKLFKERAKYEEKLRSVRNSSNPTIGTLTKNSQYGLDEDDKKGRGEQSLTEEPEKQISALTSKFDKEKSNLQNDKRKLMDTIHALTKEINVLKCEKRESKNCYKQEIEKLVQIHEVEKITILQRAAREKEEEISRIKGDFQEKLSSERKQLQSIIDDLRYKISQTERKVEDMEAQQKNDKLRWDEEKVATERTLNQSREDLKITLEREYRKMLNGEKQKFEETVRALTKQVSFLQNQRKEIQAKLVNNELTGNSKTNSDHLTRNRMVIEMEQEFLERSNRERRSMENNVKELQREISKLQREKSELKATLETEKQELEEDLEKMRSDMRRKLSKAREEMDRRTDSFSKNLVANKVKNVLTGSDMACPSCQQSTDSEVSRYKDQINTMEQRNMTLNAKTERLERELRIMGDRLMTLETRNKDLETANREEWSMYRNETGRSSLGYLGESGITGGNDLSLGSNFAGLRFEGRPYQPKYSPRISYSNAGQSLTSLGQAYGDILDRVRYTMHTAGSIADALGETIVDTGGVSNKGLIRATGIGSRQSGPMGNTAFSNTVVNPLDGRNVINNTYRSNESMVVGNATGNGTAEVVRTASHGGEGNHQLKA